MKSQQPLEDEGSHNEETGTHIDGKYTQLDSEIVMIKMKKPLDSDGSHDKKIGTIRQ